MTRDEIKEQGLYIAKVSNRLTKVRVDKIEETFVFGRKGIRYLVTNMVTGRRTSFHSAAKFRRGVEEKRETKGEEK
jgi:hypothetical protein